MEENPKDLGGRPPVPDDERLIQRSIRLKRGHWDKIDQAGGLEALRRLIDRWKPKSKGPGEE